MSTIKSSDEHLTLNADGTSKDIKFQANGVEKASISSAGAFTSTTIDATKLTGTIPNFTSTGIDDNADATAMTITSAEKIGIGTATPICLVELEHSNTIALSGDGDDSAINIACIIDAKKTLTEQRNSIFRLNNNSTKINLIIGPEGDFTDIEKIFLNEKNFIQVNLGRTILRSETAIVSLIAIVNELIANNE